MPVSAQCRVYIAFSDGPLVASPTWTEVTAWTRSVRTSRGRSNELEEFNAGTATIVLDNRTRRFDPDYTAGPYHPNVLPRRQIKVEAVYLGVTYPVFRGLAQSWVQSYPSDGRDATATVQAADLFALLATWTLPDTAHELAVRALSAAPVAHWSLADSDNVALDLRGVANGQHAGVRRERVDALVVGGDGASAYENVAGGLKPTHWLYVGSPSTKTAIAAVVYRPPVEYTGNVYPVGCNDVAAGSSLFISSEDDNMTGVANIGLDSATVVGSDIDQGKVRHVALVRDGTTITLYVDGVSQGTGADVGMTGTTATLEGYIGWGGVGSGFVVDEAMLWHGTVPTAADIEALSAAALTAWAPERVEQRLAKLLDLLDVPSALYSTQTSSSSLGPFEGGGDALSYLQSMVRGEMGRLYVSRAGVITFEARTDDMGAASAVTFADDNTANSVRYTGFQLELDDRLVYNDVTVAGTGEASFTAQNTTSIATYSRRGLTVQTQLPTSSACRDVAEIIVARYANPQSRGRSWTVYPERALNGSSTLAWASVLGRELGDVVTVKRTLPVGTAISKTVQVTSIEHQVDMSDGRWDVTFTGAPVDTSSAFRWGSSNWGGSDEWNSSL